MTPPTGKGERRYRVRVWCPDCTGVDFQGCFEGGDDLSEETYATHEEAEAAGHESVRHSIYEFDVEEDTPTAQPPKDPAGSTEKLGEER